MKARTGRSLDQWVERVESSDVDRLARRAIRRMRKAEGVGQCSHRAIADGGLAPERKQRTEGDLFGDWRSVGFLNESAHDSGNGEEI
jgi:hypothetical protein